ncbi:MAG: division/cell wall cluster transcriptional repressor MraZ [Ichthyobacteriaceae bacterium]|nr:division/cell wall cluster transcriptional repressor MraZ [Ichthyobacteriaceae bacterium]
MDYLFGTYECKIDAKGRLALPTVLKKQLAPFSDEGFVLKRSVFEKCLELYPLNEWTTVMNKVNKLNPFVKKNATFIRRFTAGVKPVDLDGSGRMLIAKDLLGFAEITKDVVLSVTINNIIEVWDKDKYEEVVNNSEDDFGDLAEDVMGDSFGVSE